MYKFEITKTNSAPSQPTLTWQRPCCSCVSVLCSYCLSWAHPHLMRCLRSDLERSRRPGSLWALIRYWTSPALFPLPGYPLAGEILAVGERTLFILKGYLRYFLNLCLVSSPGVQMIHREQCYCNCCGIEGERCRRWWQNSCKDPIVNISIIDGRVTSLTQIYTQVFVACELSPHWNPGHSVSGSSPTASHPSPAGTASPAARSSSYLPVLQRRHQSQQAHPAVTGLSMHG